MFHIQRSLVLRLLVPTIGVVVAMMALLGGWTAHILESEIRERARQEVAEETGRVMDTLKTIDTLSGAGTRASMKVLMEEGGRIGAPSAGPAVAAGKVPDLRLGTVSQLGSFELVDRVKTLMGGTATLFVRSGDSFVRVSTNVLRPDGGRAVGTVLDPRGRAYAAILEGSAFYGVVDILGKPYMTAYEPMRDGSGRTVGIWYTGYPLSSLGDLRLYLSQARILDHGFMALLRGDGTVVFRPEEMQDAQLQAIVKGEAPGWTATTGNFEPWRYTVVTAWPESDVAARLFRIREMLWICTVLVTVLLVSVIWLILHKLVLLPVRDLAARMESADLNTVLREPRQDEIGRLAASFDGFVLRLRTALLEVARLSAHLKSSAGVLATSAGVQAGASADGSADACRVVHSIEQIAATIEEVSESSARAARAAQETVEHAQTGQEAAGQSAESMRGLAGAVEGTALQIGKLEAHSGRIGSAISLIREIAEQTNMLALNAAIEAARAGEAGRGFAVVAGEVRRLAERTSAATSEVGEVVSAIQEETRRTVEAIARNRDAAGSERALAVETGEHLKSITQMARATGEMIVQIATAATQQRESMAMIRERVDGMARADETMAAEAKQSAEACDGLSKLAMELALQVENFRLVAQDEGIRSEEMRRRVA